VDGCWRDNALQNSAAPSQHVSTSWRKSLTAAIMDFNEKASGAAMQLQLDENAARRELATGPNISIPSPNKFGFELACQRRRHAIEHCATVRKRHIRDDEVLMR
jgi:hypothetical protein